MKDHVDADEDRQRFPFLLDGNPAWPWQGDVWATRPALACLLKISVWEIHALTHGLDFVWGRFAHERRRVRLYPRSEVMKRLDERQKKFPSVALLPYEYPIAGVQHLRLVRSVAHGLSLPSKKRNLRSLTRRHGNVVTFDGWRANQSP